MPLFALSSPSLLFAADVSSDVQQLQAEIQNKKAEIETIGRKLEEYRSRIAEYSSKANSLTTDLALLENEQAMAELDMSATQTEIDTQQLEIQLLQQQIDDTNAQLATQKALLKDVLFAVHKQDQRGGPLEVVIGANDFGDVFRAASQLADMNMDLQKALSSTQLTREDLQDQEAERTTKLDELTSLQDDLLAKANDLERAQNAKAVLLAQTQSSENQYQALIGELRQEQASISARIDSLQDEVTQRLVDEGNTDTDMTSVLWPLRGTITTTFHDPTYPFRYLFEHSGLDIAVPVGTPIRASAPGVVAWSRLGQQYGNYVMIIHENGLATLYAHMSRLDVAQDQVVSRGQIIGLSGGAAGAYGSGFSTGPHLHFEVREDGIPVDPYRYLLE